MVTIVWTLHHKQDNDAKEQSMEIDIENNLIYLDLQVILVLILMVVTIYIDIELMVRILKMKLV